MAPNPIDFNSVFNNFGSLQDNVAVLALISTILGLYILGVVWGRRADKRDILMVIIIIDCINCFLEEKLQVRLNPSFFVILRRNVICLHSKNPHQLFTVKNLTIYTVLV